MTGFRSDRFQHYSGFGKRKNMGTKSIKLEEIQSAIKEAADPGTAEFLQRYFKTGPGQYGEGDRFRGIKVPVIRKIAKKAYGLPFDDVVNLLHSSWHEDRLLALFVLTKRFTDGDEEERQKIYRTYLDHSPEINNWDLIDLSAPAVLGGFLYERDRKILFDMARSTNLWKRRMAVMATFYFIKNGDYDDSLAIAGILLNDSEDLIHKATGWMLREIGKRDMQAEETFLIEHYSKMPRTMLRYAIERFPEKRRQAYLKGAI